MAALLINLHQMIDLSLGTPDVGIINFNVLQALLHLIVKQLKLDDARVEFHGQQGTKIEGLIPCIPDKPAVDITEYIIEQTPEGEKRTKKGDEQTEKVNKILAVKYRWNGHGSDRRPKPIRAGFPLQPIRVPSGDNVMRLGRVDSVHDAIAGSLPDNANLLHAMKDSNQFNPLDDMWDLLNVTKRVEALEAMIQKLTTMMKDLSKEYKRFNLMVQQSDRGDDVFDLRDQLDDMQKQIYEMSQSDIFSRDRIGMTSSINVTTTVTVGTESRGGTGTDHRSAPGPGSRPGTATSSGQGRIMTPSGKKPFGEDSSCNICEEIDILRKSVDVLKEAINKLAAITGNSEITDFIQKLPKSPRVPSAQTDSTGTHVTPTGFSEEDKRLLQILQRKLEKVERGTSIMDKRIVQIEHNLSETQNNLENLMEEKKEDSGDERGVAQLYAELSKSADETDKLKQRIKYLNNLTTAHSATVEQLDEAIKNLDRKKLGKDEVDEMLAEKADISMVQQKVSCEQFDNVYKNTTKDILEILNRIEEIEQFCQTEIGELNSLVNDRVERIFYDKFEEFVRQKLQLLQQRIAAVANLRRDPEAAGTRSKFLRDVACISCAQDTIMQMNEDTLLPKLEPMIVTKPPKIGPILQLGNIKLNKEKLPRKDGKNVCSRYCGGSHTAIDPKTNFQKRNLPKTKPSQPELEDVYVTGTDGVFYKGISGNNECDCQIPINKIDQQEEEGTSLLVDLNKKEDTN